MTAGGIITRDKGNTKIRETRDNNRYNDAVFMRCEGYLIENIRRTVQKYALIPPGTKLVVGVSGGADSLTLLHMLYTLQSTLSCQLHVATLDHGLRGEQGAADAEYVSRFAETLKLPVTVSKANVAALAAQKKIGIEAAARLARYDFLAAVARAAGVERIAVAHHADDQAETILMHLLRGAGLRGLGGMAIRSAVPGHPALTLIRPLLWATRAQILAYCAEHGLEPREDVTNEDTAMLRNTIRLDILPRLESLNPHIGRSLSQLGDITRVENDFVEQQLQEFVLRTAVQRFDGRITVNRIVFRNLHPALQRRFINWAAREIKPVLNDLGYPHIVEAVALGLGGQQGARALLVEGLQVRVDYDVLVIERADSPLLEHDAAFMTNDGGIVVNIPGITHIPDSQWSLLASLTPITTEVTGYGSEELRLALPNQAELVLRGRREGDRFAPLGMGSHSQKLNRWMINRKIPQHLRDQIPLLCVDGTVAAVYMEWRWFVAEAYAVRDNSPRVVYFQFLQNL